MIEIGKNDEGFNEVRFLILAADWKCKSKRPVLELIGIEVELPEVEGKVSAATDGARLHIVRDLGKVIKAKPGFYSVEKSTKAAIHLKWRHNQVNGEFKRVHSVMTSTEEGTALPRVKSEAVCLVIRQMDRSFTLSMLADAMGYQSGMTPRLLVEHEITFKRRDGEDVHPVAKFVGDGWESYMMPLWD